MSLQPFQEQVVAALDGGRSVLLGAPTGAGKTTTAGIIAARALDCSRRVVYAAPSKGLAHRVFREWSQLFEQVGLVTGDANLNPNAPVRIMSIEMLRNSLLDESSPPADVLLFDEIHLMNESERASVFEECLLFAPRHVQVCCMMIPLPNLEELAAWLSERRDHPLDRIQENQRPLPLEIECFIHRLGVTPISTIDQLKRASSDERRVLLSDHETDVVQTICEQQWLPCVFFCHSRRRCEDLAFEYGEREILLPNPNVLDAYDELCEANDVTHEEGTLLLREVIEQGFAYHHAGMLPPLKEIVEDLLADELLSFVFATESLAVSLGHSVACVALDHLSKFDGIRRRPLKHEEYEQIAGRAGRHGVDATGHVLLCMQPFEMEQKVVERIVFGTPSPFSSHLSPGFATTLHLYERYGDQPDWVQESFHTYQRQEESKKPQADRRETEEPLPVVCIHDQSELIEEYQRLSEDIAECKTTVKKQQREVRKTRGQAKFQAHNELRQASALLQQVESARLQLLCARCPHRGECMQRSQKLRKAEREAKSLAHRQWRVGGSPLDAFRRRVALLQNLGMIREGHLTLKGQIASRLYGHELPMSELLFDGYLDRLDERQISILIAALCFESRDNVTYQTLDTQHLGFEWGPIEKRLQRLRERLRMFGIEDSLPGIDPALSSVVNAWYQGATFSALSMFTDAAEGDIVRGLRRCVDLLRQLSDALPPGSVRSKVERCVRAMGRDVVDVFPEEG